MTVHQVAFTVPFVHGLQRARNYPGRTVDTARNRADKLEIASAYRCACVREGKAGLMAVGVPVSVSITTHRPLPRTRPRCVETEQDITKPDIDNVAKLVLDGLNGVAYQDDAQVAYCTVLKGPRTRKDKTWTHVLVTWNDYD